MDGFPVAGSERNLAGHGLSLMWDVMAVSTYFLLSLLYWYIGLVPDFALLRDCCKGRLRRRYGWLALGWQGDGAPVARL